MVNYSGSSPWHKPDYTRIFPLDENDKNLHWCLSAMEDKIQNCKMFVNWFILNI